MAQCTEDADPEEPKTLQEALSGPNRTQWLSTIHAEVVIAGELEGSWRAGGQQEGLQYNGEAAG